LLRRIHKNLLIIEAQWVVAYPELQPRKSKQGRVKESKPGADVLQQISEAVTRAREFLELKSKASPKAAITAVRQAIDNVRRQKRRKGKNAKELAIDLGALWGEALCQALNWEWCMLREKGEGTVCAVCSPDRSHAIDPISLIYRLVTSRNSDYDNTALLVFNMIKAGDMPVSVPRGYVWLS
jgi:hypothetical protein